jgi:NAD(P)H-hydrate epimerase
MTFGLPKRGHFLHPGAEYAGVLTVADIGFPNELLESGNIPVSLPDEADIRRMLPARPRYSHKGTYGHVLLVAGSRGKTGAALMAARACLRAGAGLLTMGIPETLTSSLQSRVTEEMILPLPDQGNGTLSVKAAQTIIHFLSRKGIVLALGPGLSVNSEIADLVRTVVEETAAPMVIDADGLNALGSGISLLRKRSLPAVITPHPGEMVRLFQGRLPFRSADEKTIMKGIEEDRIGRAQAFARKMGVCLVLKGAPTVTAIPDGSVYINPTGNAGLASAGSGDVLTGIAAAFLAQGMLPREAALSAVYIHGLTGDRVAGKKGQHSLIASDLIRSLPQTLKYLAPA